VWRGQVGGYSSDYEIFLYDGGTPLQLTNNTYSESAPQISGSNVVWYGHDGNDYEIFLYNGSTTTQLTDNTFHDRDPQISGSNVVWHGGEANNYEIFFYNGSTTIQLTTNNYDDRSPQISGSDVVWQGQPGGYGKQWEIYLYKGSLPATRLTDNSRWDGRPQISGPYVVWESEDIYIYDGITTDKLYSTWVAEDVDVQISGTTIAWVVKAHAGDGDDEIYMSKPCGASALGPFVPMTFGLLGVFAVVRRRL
jgi:beta propeller repeat protein